MKTPRTDYYETLGIARDADLKTIKSAFRRLVLQIPERLSDEERQLYERLRLLATKEEH